MYRMKEDHTSTLEIQKSKFICYLHKNFDEASAKEFIRTIQKMHPDANHHCYAFIIGEHNDIQRSNDDGEPSGTAGAPILDCLMKHHMQDITAVVVRYFGGIKLGAGGLIRAYSKSTSQALKSAAITKKQEMLKYQVVFHYDMIGKIDHYFRTHSITVLQKDYSEKVIYEYLSLHDISDDILELSNGASTPSFIEKVILDIAYEHRE